MLIVGGEDLEKIKILIFLTRIRNEKMQKALIGYYCLGIRMKMDKSNWRRATNKLEEMNLIFNRIKEMK